MVWKKVIEEDVNVFFVIFIHVHSQTCKLFASSKVTRVCVLPEGLMCFMWTIIIIN